MRYVCAWKDQLTLRCLPCLDLRLPRSKQQHTLRDRSRQLDVEVCFQLDPVRQKADQVSSDFSRERSVERRGGKRTAKFNLGFSGFVGDREARMRWMNGREPVVAAR